jgi:hypothetical protein
VKKTRQRKDLEHFRDSKKNENAPENALKPNNEAVRSQLSPIEEGSAEGCKAWPAN